METQLLLAEHPKESPRPIFKNRPGLAVFIFVIAGMALADQRKIGWSIAIYILAGALLSLPAIFLIAQRELRHAIALIACAALGLSLYSFASHQQITSSLARYAEQGGRSKVMGVVSEVEKTRRGHLMIVDVSSVASDSVVIISPGKLAVQISEPHEDAEIVLPSEGDTIELFADIFPLRPERNPYAGSYDERLQYHYGANATAQLGSRFDYYLRPSDERSLWRSFRLFFSTIKRASDEILDNHIVDKEASAFVRAVVLGIRGDLPESTVLDFKYSGLTHLLAISGFNIAVVALLIAQGLLLIGIRRRAFRLPITAVAVAFYCFLVGLEPSVLRAFIMIELYILALVLERKSDLANIAALTALAHLFIDPMVVHDAGFQLSYAAVFGFALIQPELSRLFEPERDGKVKEEVSVIQWLRHSLILSVAAFMATAPVLLFHFRQVSLVVLIANLSAIPLTAAITTLGFILIPLGVIWPTAAMIYGDVITWLVELLLTSSSWLARVTQGGFMLDLNIVAVLVLALGLLCLVRAPKRPQLAGRALALCVIAFLVVSFIPIGNPQVLPQDKLSLVIADVGQGDAAILRTPSGKFYMFDFGPLNGSDQNFNARAYGALLQVEGADKLEAGFITHLHRDHYAALYSAVHSEAVGTVYTVGDRTSDEFAYSLDSMVRQKRIIVKALTSGEILELEPGVKLYVLSPDSSERRDEINNDRSLVLKLVYGNTSFLLLGDIEQEAEKELVARFGEVLKSDVVKVAHHGSISSSTQELVRASDPRFAVISCGRNNRFGHPHRKVVSRWMRTGADVLRTDQDGAIIFASDGKHVERVNWR